MSSERNRRASSDEALRDLLRRGDPAGDGAQPSAEEWSRVRRRILAAEAAGAAPARSWRELRWATALAAAAILVLFAVAPDAPRPAPLAPAAPAAPSASSGERQIHFQTSGGTRIIWVLQPDRVF